MVDEMSECLLCQRPAFLWGGDTCDVCDKDGNGVNDRDEPVGISPTTNRMLFALEDKGFAIIDAGHLQISVGEWPIHPTARQWNLYQRVLKIIDRKYKLLKVHGDGSGELA